MTSFTNKTKRLFDMIASYNLDEKMPSEMRFNQFVIRLLVTYRHSDSYTPNLEMLLHPKSTKMV